MQQVHNSGVTRVKDYHLVAGYYISQSCAQIGALPQAIRVVIKLFVSWIWG